MVCAKIVKSGTFFENFSFLSLSKSVEFWSQLGISCGAFALEERNDDYS
jgi:hypothetical protein